MNQTDEINTPESFAHIHLQKTSCADDLLYGGPSVLDFRLVYLTMWTGEHQHLGVDLLYMWRCRSRKRPRLPMTDWMSECGLHEGS
jgi:hypothetical protein